MFSKYPNVLQFIVKNEILGTLKPRVQGPLKSRIQSEYRKKRI